MSHDSLFYIFYTGSSMHPTLKTGDVLCVVRYNGRKVRRGDVVVFSEPQSSRYITHRVISINSQYITTLGDNNTKVDDYILKHDHVVGRVSYALRKRRRICIYGGALGQLFSLTTRLLKPVRGFLISVLHPIYDYSSHSNFVKHIHPHIRTRIVSFHRYDRAEKKLFIGRWVIGWYVPKSSHWHIKPPFKLIVDENSLMLDEEKRPGSCYSSLHK